MNKAEQFVKKTLDVPCPDNWDKYDKEIPRYSLNDLEDVAEQFADKQLTEYQAKLAAAPEMFDFLQMVVDNPAFANEALREKAGELINKITNNNGQ
jgi:hypothetical protein